MLQNLFKPRPRDVTAQRLYQQAVDQARHPAFYTALGVPDRIDARFELYTLHVLLLNQRLRAEGEGGDALAQAVFDTYVSALDHTLRELGVGDISVGKKMRKLGESLYGRLHRYEPLLAQDDQPGLAEALARNVYENDDPRSADPLAAYALASRRRLMDQDWSTPPQTPAWEPLT